MQHVARWRQVELADVEITMPQARCLMYLAISPSVSITALATHLHIGLPAASGLVERLVEAGHVMREPDPHDRRQQLVSLTGQGQALVDRFHELPAEKLGELIAGLSVRELRGLRLGVSAIEREARRIAEDVPRNPDSERNPT
jgi:DNA-binding MarR family transcriptional regulator